MTIITVYAECLCCGAVGSFTTNTESADDTRWIEEMVTTYCCYLDSITEYDDEYEDSQNVHLEQGEEYIPF